MQSSFRSCKWLEPINLLLAAGTDNLLAGTEARDKTKQGRLLHEYSQLDKQCFTIVHGQKRKYVIMRKTF